MGRGAVKQRGAGHKARRGGVKGRVSAVRGPALWAANAVPAAGDTVH